MNRIRRIRLFIVSLFVIVMLSAPCALAGTSEPPSDEAIFKALLKLDRNSASRDSSIIGKFANANGSYTIFVSDKKGRMQGVTYMLIPLDSGKWVAGRMVEMSYFDGAIVE